MSFDETSETSETSQIPRVPETPDVRDKLACSCHSCESDEYTDGAKIATLEDVFCHVSVYRSVLIADKCSECLRHLETALQKRDFPVSRSTSDLHASRMWLTTTPDFDHALMEANSVHDFMNTASHILCWSETEADAIERHMPVMQAARRCVVML